VPPPNMLSMRSTAPITPLRSGERDRRMLLAARARKRLDRGRGRIWLNGRELGGPDPRYEQLARSYD
jgi:hypothetical protein